MKKLDHVPAVHDRGCGLCGRGSDDIKLESERAAAATVLNRRMTFLLVALRSVDHLAHRFQTPSEGHMDYVVDRYRPLFDDRKHARPGA